MRKRALILAAVAIACGSDPSGVTDAVGQQTSGAGGAELRGDARYIVVFAPGVADPEGAARALLRAHGGALGFVYRHALSGFSAELPAAAVEAIARNPVVAYVERDQVMGLFAQTVPTGIRRTFADRNANLDVDGSDDLRVDVDVAVIDTGIDFDHPDLNVVARTDCSGGGPFKATCSDGSGDDGNGHGTHCAGTIAAIDDGVGVVGVAPGARLWAVKVLGDNGSGWNSGIIAGVDWVTARAATIDVANMSLGGGNSTALCDAIRSSVREGVVYAAAAGNSDDDAAKYSPANCADVITVSALADFDGIAGGASPATCRVDQDDTLADFSNWGSTIELAAPGVCILSTWAGGGYETISGTSMASPHVAGGAALLKASGVGDPAEVRRTLVEAGNLDWTDDSGDGIRERLLDVSSTTVFAPAMVPGSSSPPVTDTSAPVISGVAASNVTSSSATITWITDEPSDSVVRYGVSAPPGSSAGSATLVTSHSVTLTGLAAGTTYYYEVESKDAAGNTAVANDGGAYHAFTTGPASPAGIGLSASPYKVKGIQHASLTWQGAASANVDVWRDGQRIATTANDGAHEDRLGTKGGGSYVYRVCEEGTTTCSNDATVTF